MASQGGASVDRVNRFGVSMEPELLAALDAFARRRGYGNRSEALRDMVRSVLVEDEWQDERRPVIGTVTLVYDHHSHDLAHKLMDLQHDHHEAIVSAGAVSAAVWRLNRNLDAERVPLMRMAGTFIFAAQMVNFPVAVGISGHLLGGFLAALLLGPAPAIVVMTTVFTVQCLLFQDG